MKKTIMLTTILIFTAPLMAKVTCGQLSSCAEACKYLAQGNVRLDNDHDGIPCEKLCHSPCKKQEPKKKAKNKK